MTVATVALSIQLFGAPTFHRGRHAEVFPCDKRHQLLAYLAYRGEWVSRDQLAELFWSESTGTAKGNLRRLLGRVQELPWLTGLEVERSRVRWAVHTDAAAFKKLLASGDPGRALDLYAGPFMRDLDGYDGSEFMAWLEIERAILSEQWRSAILNVVTARLKEGQAEKALVLLKALMDQEPFDEEAVQLYLVTSAQTGRTHQALEHYKHFARQLKREMGIEPNSKTLQLAKKARESLEQEAPADSWATEPTSGLSPAGRKLSSLPTPATSFVGRDLELAEIANLLLDPACRILSVIGPGGIGKTRLALQAARELEHGYQNGAYFVGLAHLTYADAILPHLASAVGAATQATETFSDAIVRKLTGSSTLIVLDNFEHVIEGNVHIADLVSRCPDLTVIVTSRERLQLSEEHTLYLYGLELPGAASKSNEAQTFDGVKLFLERAKRVYPHITLDAAETAAVTRICTLVEGSPLGIELAAAWMRALPASEIAREINRSLDFLASTARDTADRHRSLRATFEYSWQLLTKGEQDLLAGLSVFRGGFSREAATYVAGANLAMLTALIDKSLLRYLSNRYGFHPLVRQYAREKLAGDSEHQAATEAKHATFFAHLVEHAKDGLGPDQVSTLRALDSEYANVLNALEWSYENGALDTGLRLAGNLQTFWLSRGRFDDGYAWLERLLTHSSSLQHPLLRNQALGAAGMLANKRADYRAAQVYFGQLLTAAREADDSASEVTALNGLGMTSQASRDYDLARQHYETALELLERADDLLLLSVTLKNLGNVAMEQGNFFKARELYEESLLQSRRSGHQINLAIVMVNLGLALYRLGDIETSVEQLGRALKFSRELPYLPATIAALQFSGVAFIDSQRLGDASACLAEALALCWKHQDRPGVAFSLENIASLMAAKLQPHHAAVLWGAAEGLRESLRFPLEPSWRPWYHRFVDMAKGRTSEGRFRQDWLQGCTQSLDETVNNTFTLLRDGLSPSPG